MPLKCNSSRIIDLDRLSAKPCFQLSLGRPLPPLRESLKRLGQLEPLLVMPASPGDTLMVISGFRRLQALRELGCRQALATVVEADKNELLELALETNRPRGFNTAEKILAAGAWESEGRPFPPGHLGLLLDETLGPRQLSAYQTAVKLPPDFLEALSGEPFDLGDFTELARRPLQEARALSALWLRFALSRQKRRQTAELIDDIARRENLPPCEVMAGPEVYSAGALLERAGKPQAGEALRQALLRRRQPQLTLWRDQRQRLLQNLALKPGLQLSWDKSLEDPSLTLSFAATTLDHFRSQVESLNQLCFAPELKGLFAPLKVEPLAVPLKARA